MTILLRLVFLSAALLTAACGKRGSLIPPDGIVPPPVPALQVRQQGEGFRISWLAPEPELPPGGASSLAGFRLYRRELRSPAGDCPGCDSDELLLRSVDLEYLRETVRLGNLFVVVDGDVKVGRRYQYQVTAIDKGGAENRESAKVTRKKVPPPPRPDVRIGEVPAGLLLEWSPVQVTAGALAGYNVYRLRPGERLALRPLNPAPLTETRYEDLRMEQGMVYRYQVHSVALVAGETVESDPSPEVEGTFVLPQ